MDDTDRRLVTLLHDEIPVEAKPFDRIAKKLHLDTGEVILRMHRLLEEGFIQSITPIFDIRQFGYVTALVAAKVPSTQLEGAIQGLKQCRQVWQALGVEHPYNIWYTLTDITEKAVGICIQELHQTLQARESIPFFIILKEKERISGLDEITKSVLAVLQKDFPVTDAPFKKLAALANCDEATFLEECRRLREKKILSRIVARMKKKRHSGLRSMIAWQIPKEKRTFVSKQLDKEKTVKKSFWCEPQAALPYSFFTVVEAHLNSEFESLSRKIENKIGSWPKTVLMTHTLYKKTQFQMSPEDKSGYSRAKHSEVVETRTP